MIGAAHKKSAPYLCNRAMCYLKREDYQYAINDGEAAMIADPTFSKGLYRQCSGYFAIGKLNEALRCVTAIKVKLGVNTADVRSKIDEIRAIQKEKLFFESIVREDDIAKLSPGDIFVGSMKFF